MKEEPTSKVWLVSQESVLGNGVNAKVSKQKLFEYEPGKPILLPIGYVIEHPEGKGSSYEDVGSYLIDRNLVPRPVVSGVEISHLEGELLTIIDASFADKAQCEAMKSLVRKTLWTFNQRAERKVEEIFKNA